MEHQHPIRPKTVHVFIIDGTMSRLDEGDETNAGLLYKLLKDQGPQRDQTVSYHPGVQATGMKKWVNIAAGIGINQSILEGYATLSSRYEPGDSIMLFGFSRGAYAVRSLAGLINRVGLLRKDAATQRRIHRAFRHYEARKLSPTAQDFSRIYCHENVPIQMLGVWDTVKALGLPYPVLNRLAPMATEFHDHALGQNVANAFQALALDENRSSYAPLPWRVKDEWPGHIEQMWFAGAHPDIGGHVRGRPKARFLANIPLVWMLAKAEACGLKLPPDWEAEFPTNAAAPMAGAYSGIAKFFIARAPREPFKCSSEALHPSVLARRAALPRYRPRAKIRLPEPKTGSEIERPERIPSHRPA